jgi:hypothetical protein
VIEPTPHSEASVRSTIRLSEFQGRIAGSGHNSTLSDEENPRKTIDRLWDILDSSELSRMLGRKQNARMIGGRKKPPAP